MDTGGGASAPPLNIRTSVQWAWIEDRFKPDGLLRLARADRDYVDSHGHYLPDVAALALRYHGEAARLREERDAAQREADIQMGQKLAAQVTLKAITDSLCLPFAELGDGWTEATPKILARIEEIVDEGERWFQEATRLRSDKDERDWRTLEIVTAQAQAAEARCARLQQALEDEQEKGRYAVQRARIAERRNERLQAAVDDACVSFVDTEWERAYRELAQASGSGSSAAASAVGERQGRHPDPGEVVGLLVELARWSRVAELDGDLHARIASALAGPDTSTRDPDLAHWTRRMLQALDAYWLWYDGWNGPQDRRPLSESTAEDWWYRFEKYRARVVAILTNGGKDD